MHLFRARWKGLSPELNTRVEEVCESWRGTQYGRGQKCKGVAADCFRSIFGALDDLFGRVILELPNIPHDAAFHSPKTALRALEEVEPQVPGVFRADTNEFNPGDVIIVGPNSPAHAMMVGGRRNVLWHCSNSTGWKPTGMGSSLAIFRRYSFTDEARSQWLNS